MRVGIGVLTANGVTETAFTGIKAIVSQDADLSLIPSPTDQQGYLYVHPNAVLYIWVVAEVDKTAETK